MTNKGPNKSIYFGAGGVLFGLKHLEENLNLKSNLDFSALLEKLVLDYQASPDMEMSAPSLSIGESGLLLLHFLWTKQDKYLPRLSELIEANIRNPTLEALWAAPGTMVAAWQMYCATHNEQWKKLYQQSADYLFETWTYPFKSSFVWQQDLYEKKRRIVGAGHGFFGNVQALLVGKEFLSEEQQKTLVERTSIVTQESAIHEDGLCNWPYLFDEESDRGILMQWCHGAPGVTTSLRNFPQFPEIEELLLKGGEAIWRAGALNKGVGICHSTDGNAWAFLHLYKRTEQEIWLERARSFAMHALTQRNGRFTMWTGEVGLSCLLLACINKDDRIPTLDFF